MNEGKQREDNILDVNVKVKCKEVRSVDDNVNDEDADELTDG